jgi:hypothetical protein
VRDGAAAVAIMRILLAELPAPDPRYLDPLAAALAETGDFDEAVRAQARAIALLEGAGASPELVGPLDARLAAYRRGEPTRDPAPAAS